MDTKKKNKKTIDYYLNLPWTYTIETTKENGKLLYIVYVSQLLSTKVESL